MPIYQVLAADGREVKSQGEDKPKLHKFVQIF
jgi:hypothetical protein